MKEYKNIICSIIIAISIIISGTLISNSILEGFKIIQGSISYMSEMIFHLAETLK